MKSGRKINIFAVDDDESGLISARGLIKSLGLRDLDVDEVKTHLVTNNETSEGLADIIGFPDVVILDYQLNHFTTGVKVARTIREKEILNKIPRKAIIINTAHKVLSSGELDQNSPADIKQDLDSARDDGIIDSVCEKGKDLDYKIRKILHMPLRIGQDGRGGFSLRLLEGLLNSESVLRVYNHGKSISKEDLFPYLEQRDAKDLFQCMIQRQRLFDASSRYFLYYDSDMIVDCASTLRWFQVTDVILKHLTKTGKFFDDRQVIFPYERERIEKSHIEMDTPFIALSNAIPYELWLKKKLGYDTKFLYSPLQPDTTRLVDPLEKVLSEFRYKRFVHESPRFMCGVHGDIELIVPKTYDHLIGERERKLIDLSQQEAKDMAYKSQAAARRIGKPVCVPPALIVSFFESLAHFRNPDYNVTGYLTFEYPTGSGEIYEGFDSFPPLFNWKDLSLAPDWYFIDNIIGRERFMASRAPKLKAQKEAFYRMMDEGYKKFEA